MSKQKLSPKQEQILEYIKSQILEKGGLYSKRSDEAKSH